MNGTYFAKVENGIVTKVKVVSWDFIVANPERYGDSSQYVETFLDGSQRGKYAGVGDTYDADLDEFVAPPQPEPVDDDSVA
jgi:hypothetical protein